MIPLRDTIPSRTFPFVNVGLILANVLVFVQQLSAGPLGERLVQAYGVVPARFTHWVELGGGALEPERFLPLFTSMFFHGGLLHLAGNLLYLWIFGDNVEDRLGHVRYLLFYLAAGVVAALAQVAYDPNSLLPTIGASGAIAGVLGAYLIAFPTSRVLTFVPLFFLPWLVEVPAVVYLVLWFLMQVASALTELGRSAAGVPSSGGVAWWAHAGGFVAGVLLLFLLAPAKRRRAARA